MDRPAAPQDTPGTCVEGIEARIGWLHVIQHVAKVKVERAAETLVDLNLLGNAQVQVPEWQAPEDTAAPNLPIQTKNRVADWITEDPRTALETVAAFRATLAA